MPALKFTAPDHELRCQFKADSVESEKGIIRGCTVAQANVEAKGKKVWLDKKGAITRDEKLCVTKLPVFTDQKTLETLMLAAKVAGSRVKTREDHDDSIGARAGFSTEFRIVGDRVVTDLHLFNSYRNRQVVVETADQTPEEIGLSIDFTPEYEIAGDKALMRVKSLHAVDIVDEGAITHGGMFLSAGVDTDSKSQGIDQLQTPTQMTNEEIMAAFAKQQTSIDACMAAVAKMSAPVAEVKKEELAAVLAENTKLAATVKEQGEKLVALNTEFVKNRRERALLGYRGTAEDRQKLAAASTPEEIETLSAKKPQTYLQMVADARSKDAKLSASDAHDRVRHSDEGRAAYAAHLESKGIVPKANMAA